MSNGNGLQVSGIRFGEPTAVWRFLADGAGLMLTAAGLGLAVTGIGASGTGELSLDVYLAQHRSVALSEVALVIDVLLGVSVAPIVLVAVAGLVAKVWHWMAGVLVVVVTGAAWVASAIVKVLVHRSRPPGGVLHALVSEMGTDSFPSGHTAFAAGLLASAVVISYLYGRSAWRTACLGLPGLVLVGVSRLYLGVHYLADVIGSCLVAGSTTLLLVGMYTVGLRLLRSRSRTVSWPGTTSAGAGVQPSLPAEGEDLIDAGAADEDPRDLVGAESSSGEVDTLLDMLGGDDADPRR